MVEHDGVLTIDLGAIQRNWLRARGMIEDGAECGAVVKANAYGLGVEEVSRCLYRAGCRQFFVATLSEGVNLRQHLPMASKIFILTGIRAGCEADCIAANLIPVLSTPEQIRCWQRYNRRAGLKSVCAIKVDTGMTRLGLRMKDFDKLYQQRDVFLDCHPVLFMSHLACADDSEHPLNHLQLINFQQAALKMRELITGIPLSLANSAGLCLGQQWHFDLVRPGVALYGVNPQPGAQSLFEPVMQLHLPIIQIREVSQPGGSIGYGASYDIGSPMRLAVVFGGYADGIHRTMGNSGHGMLAGVRVPIVGRISMDSTVFDISAVPKEKLPQEGVGSIQLIGAGISIDEAAAAAGTIGYEILTSLGQRYHRRYLNNVDN